MAYCYQSALYSLIQGMHAHVHPDNHVVKAPRWMQSRVGERPVRGDTTTIKRLAVLPKLLAFKPHPPSIIICPCLKG
jgi:hypothetical protein